MAFRLRLSGWLSESIPTHGSRFPCTVAMGQLEPDRCRSPPDAPACASRIDKQQSAAAGLACIGPHRRWLEAVALIDDLAPQTLWPTIPAEEWWSSPRRTRKHTPRYRGARSTAGPVIGGGCCGARGTARGVAVGSRTHAWFAVLHPALHSPLQGSASARPVDRPVSKECSGTNAELPMSTPSSRIVSPIPPSRRSARPWQPSREICTAQSACARVGQTIKVRRELASHRGVVGPG